MAYRKKKGPKQDGQRTSPHKVTRDWTPEKKSKIDNQLTRLSKKAESPDAVAKLLDRNPEVVKELLSGSHPKAVQLFPHPNIQQYLIKAAHIEAPKPVETAPQPEERTEPERPVA